MDFFLALKKSETDGDDGGIEENTSCLSHVWVENGGSTPWNFGFLEG